MMVAVGFLTLSAAVTAEWVNSYPAARQIAAQRNQPIFLYFRKASAPACQNFENQVLTQPAVSSALAGFVPVYLDPAWNETLAEQYGVYRVPAVVLVDTQGTLLYREQGTLPAEGLAQALARHGAPPPAGGNLLPTPTRTALPPVPAAPEENEGIVMMPVPEAARLKPIRVQARTSEAEQLRLRFRMQGQKDYLDTPMRQLPQPGWWEGEIPGWIVTPEGVEYYLSGQRQGQAVTVPREAPRKPYRVKVH